MFRGHFVKLIVCIPRLRLNCVGGWDVGRGSGSWVVV